MTISQNISLLTSVTILFSGTFGLSPKAVAAPAEIFTSLIPDIQEQLPTGASFRLPAYIPESSVDLYPFFVSDDKGFRVNITTEPSCQVSSCTTGVVGGLGVLAEREIWPPADDNVSLVSLTSDLDGYLITRGRGKNKQYNILWQQDGQIYVVGALDLVISSSDLVEVAKSMVQEQPITRLGENISE